MLTARLLCGLVAVSFVSVPARASEPSVEARRLYAEGKAEYALGHYVEAIAFFERSYALSESPALLFNMAQAHRLAGPEHCARAVALYQRYLQAEPAAENAKEVVERLQELGACGAESAPAAAPNSNETAPIAPPATPPRAISSTPAPRAAPSAAPAAARRRGLPTGPVLVTGTGAALAVAGGVLYAVAWNKHREAEKVCPCYPGSYSSWEVLTDVSYALLAAGGATLGGGIVWWVTASPSARSEPRRAMWGISGRF